jgi:hypothetical protein
MNSFELSRKWFDWCFENPEKITPSHTAIYFFAIEHCNRLGWKEKFGFPTQMAMEALGIKKNSTYLLYFNDLVDWGFFKLVEKSRNQYSANIISLNCAIPKIGKALDQALIKHGTKQIDSKGISSGISEGRGNGSINKQYNNITIEQIIIYFDENGYSEISAKKFYDYYAVTNWVDSKGKKVKSWKQKAQSVWFKPENKKPEPSKQVLSIADQIEAMRNG